ncbi:MAG: AMP-binding protein [Chloroflexota bacterium]|nr:AMP-binding protein [Chloroflexota bacterium]
MITALGDTRLLQRPDPAARLKLGASLRYAYSTFSTYRDLFESAGVRPDDLSQNDPIAVLERLPIISANTLAKVSVESLSVASGIVDMETSSGTTGARKKRFISYEDDRNDHDFMAELFRVAGITEQDRVTCLDTDPVYLMVSFARALDLLGVDEAYVYSVGRDQGQTLDALVRLDPTAIFAVPSMFERCWSTLRRLYAAEGHGSLRKVVFLGERVPPQLRAQLESDNGIEVFSYYGAAETSSLGIECAAHTGIHLFTDRNVYELTPPEREGSDGQLVVTSLVQKTFPLVRYALGDEIVVLPGECPCRLSQPRVDVLGRAGDSFSILGSKFYYYSLLRSVFRKLDEVGYMQVVLTTEVQDVLTILLPDEIQPHEKRMKDSLLSNQLELEFLVTSKLASVRFDYVDESYFTGSRKMKLVDDRRKGAAA